MDLSDLRQAATDEERWFSRKRQKLEVGLPVHPTEADKACSAPEDADAGIHKFNRLFRVGSDRIIRSGQQPTQESPSVKLWHCPTVCSIAIKSTFRMRLTFKLEDDDGSNRSYFATGFGLSPTVSVTAGHCLILQDANMESIRACHGSFVSGDMLEDLGGVCFGLHQHHLTPASDWPEDVDEHGDDLRVEGLSTQGADLSFLVAKSPKHMEVGLFMEGDVRHAEFLLPCSPFFSDLQDDNIFILSYPGVDNFLADAEEDLINKAHTNSDTWNAYEPAMREELTAAVKKFATKSGKSEEDISLCPASMKQILSEVKQVLWDHLRGTFGKFSSGTLLCSVGTRIVKDGNKFCFGSTASTLPGSSGAAICPQGFPGYFIGIHSGGSRGWDQNVGTSSDNPIFVVGYTSHVLPTLPPPDSSHWKDFNLQPFLDWLYRHAQMVQASPWLEEAAKRFKSSGSQQQ